MQDDAAVAEARDLYNVVIDKAPHEHDAYIELAELVVASDPAAAVDVYCKFPVQDDSKKDDKAADEGDTNVDESYDDAYIHGEIVRLLVKIEQYDDPRLEKSMISVGRLMGLSYLEKPVKKLEDKFKYKMLMRVYAGVNRTTVDDPDMEAFFKVKCWK